MGMNAIGAGKTAIITGRTGWHWSLLAAAAFRKNGIEMFGSVDVARASSFRPLRFALRAYGGSNVMHGKLTSPDLTAVKDA